MRLHALTIEHFRGIDHLELCDLPETGVVVIHGDNEAGKSTILDAISTVLQERHSAGGKKIRIYAPIGKDESPAVTLEATVGKYHFRIHKQWLSGKKSELQLYSPQKKQFTGRAADDELERILNEELDYELARTLFLRQGKVGEAISAAGIPSIAQTLDAETGEQQQTQDDTALMQRVSEEYRRYFTATGRARGEYADLFTRVDKARSAFDTLQEQRKKFDRNVQDVEDKQRKLRTIAEELPEAKQALATHEAEAEKAAQLKSQIDTAQTSVEQAQKNAERAKEDIAAREVLEEQLKTLEREQVDLQRELADAQEAKQEEAERYEQRAQQHSEAQRGLEAAEAKRKTAKSIYDAAVHTQRLQELEQLVERIDAVNLEYEQLLAKAPTPTVDAATLRAIEDAANELNTQRRVRDLAAAHLEITADKTASFTYDGTEYSVGEHNSVKLFDGTSLQFGDFQLTYRAGASGENLSDAVEEAEQALRTLLADADCETLEDAREAADASQRYEAELRVTRRRREDVLGNVDEQQVRAELRQLRTKNEAFAEVKKVPLDKATSALEDAEAKLEACQDAVSNAKAKLEPLREQPAAIALIKLEERINSREKALKDAKTHLQDVEKKHSKKQLEAALEAAETHSRDTEQHLLALKEQAATADLEMAEALFEGAKHRVENLEKRYQETDKLIAGLESSIRDATGVAEQYDRAAAEVEAAEMELRSATRRAEATELLFKTLQRHKTEANARYAAPFVAALQKFARGVFGADVDFALNEDLQITHRSVDGATVEVDQLSGGAREQLGLLTRFALAELVTSESGSAPVPIVVDDVLGATDPTRLLRMNSLFSRVGAFAQVFVFTCFPNRFDSVAAAAHYAIDELKS